jgi:hypothetical protein
MKNHKLVLFKRISKKLGVVVGGCGAADCPFKADGLLGGSARPCNCGEEARGLTSQLDRELKTVGL